MSQGFQSQVNTVQAPGVPGDFASTNPRSVVLAGAFGLVCGAAGVTVGRFAWATFPPDNDGAPAIVNNFVAESAPPTGFVHRAQQGLITTFLQNASQVVPEGFPITLFDTGDFWVENSGSGQATPGMKAFANLADGSVSFAAAGTIVGGASGATASIATTTLTLSGSVQDNVLTVISVSAGTVYPGAVLSSNAVGQVVSQLSGTPGGAGTYLLSIGGQSVASPTTIGGTYGLMSNGTVTGTFAKGMVLTGTGVDSGTVITQIVSGAGGTGGTSVVSSPTTVGSATIVGSTSVETKWYCRSLGSTGEVVKMSSTPLG